MHIKNQQSVSNVKISIIYYEQSKSNKMWVMLHFPLSLMNSLSQTRFKYVFYFLYLILIKKGVLSYNFIISYLQIKSNNALSIMNSLNQIRCEQCYASNYLLSTNLIKQGVSSALLSIIAY